MKYVYGTKSPNNACASEVLTSFQNGILLARMLHKVLDLRPFAAELLQSCHGTATEFSTAELPWSCCGAATSGVRRRLFPAAAELPRSCGGECGATFSAQAS